MIGNNSSSSAIVTLVAGVVVMLFPIYLIAVSASVDAATLATKGVPYWFGPHLWENLESVWSTRGFGRQILNSAIVGLMVAAGKLALASMTAFAVVFFDTRFTRVMFWLAFLTLMLPLEVRIVPTYEVAANVLQPIQSLLATLHLDRLISSIAGIELGLHWSLLNTYVGLSLPLIATATGTFLFRQFFKTIPKNLVEAAKMDGAGPVRFYFEILLPLSRPYLAALATIMFLSAWNQYLWPLLITTEESMRMVTVGVTQLMPDLEYEAPAWNLMMAGALIAIVPPLIVVAVFQRHLVAGLTSGWTQNRNREK